MDSNNPTAVTQPEISDASPLPVSELGRSIKEVLFNSSLPHKHMIHFNTQLDHLLQATYDIPLGDWMEGSSSFFQYGRSRYLFPSDPVLPPVIVMKSMDELETAKREHNKYRMRIRPEMVQRIKEALKKSKHSKKGGNVTVNADKPNTSSKTQAVDDEIDIFGEGLVVNTDVVVKGPLLNEPLFASADTNKRVSEPVNAIASDEQIKDILRKKAAMRDQVQHRPSTDAMRFQDDDIFPTTAGGFGEKLDSSKFVVDDSGATVSKKQKLGQEKQQFNEVMKRLAKDKM